MLNRLLSYLPRFFQTFAIKIRSKSTAEMLNNWRKEKGSRLKFMMIDFGDAKAGLGVSPFQTLEFFRFFSYLFENGKATDVILRPKITTTDESLRRFSPKYRNCYFEGEKKLKYFTKYSKHNCLDECWSDLSFDVYGCVRFYLIRKVY